MNDWHLAVDSAIGTFFALMFIEALVKPIARHTGRWLLGKLDGKIKIIPDWLSQGKSE